MMNALRIRFYVIVLQFIQDWYYENPKAYSDAKVRAAGTLKRELEGK